MMKQIGYLFAVRLWIKHGSTHQIKHAWEEKSEHHWTQKINFLQRDWERKSIQIGWQLQLVRLEA